MNQDDDITPENAEKIAIKAVNSYFDKGMLADALFWRHTLACLKRKWTGVK